MVNTVTTPVDVMIGGLSYMSELDRLDYDFQPLCDLLREQQAQIAQLQAELKQKEMVIFDHELNFHAAEEQIKKVEAECDELKHDIERALEVNANLLAENNELRTKIEKMEQSIFENSFLLTSRNGKKTAVAIFDLAIELVSSEGKDNV